MVNDELGRFVRPARVFSRDEVLSSPSPVPAQDGVYGWWFRRLPPLVVSSDCCRHQGLTLLYAGISPDRPPRDGQPASRQSLLNRIKYYVSWAVRQQPWELEDYLITSLDLPLNLMGNKHNQFHPTLTLERARCVARARNLPPLLNPGTGGR